MTMCKTSKPKPLICVVYKVDGHPTNNTYYPTMEAAMRAIDRFERRWAKFPQWNARYEIDPQKARDMRHKLDGMTEEEWQAYGEARPAQHTPQTVGAINAALFGF